jgi:AcrR family transcriptional regulator
MNAVQKEVRKPSPRVGRDVLRDQALAAGRLILNEEGWRALNARRIAAAIGAAVGTLYNLFDNFEEFILALNLETLQELGRVLPGDDPPPADPEAAVLAIARRYLDFTAQHRNRWASVLEFKTPAPHRYAHDFPETIGRLVGVVEQALAPLFPPGHETERRLSAAVLWSSLEGINALTAADNLRMVAPATAWEMASALIVNYLAGLRLKTPER